jgi:predicted glutamine amidotransferase
MCRMIMAFGRFASGQIFDSAICMSEGITAGPQAPAPCHRNGWGAVWKDPRTQRLKLYRDTRPIAEGFRSSGLPGLETDFLAVHVRHATLPHTQGMEYTHPITRPGSRGPWFLMHNGYLPTVFRELGMAQSRFDTAEYFEYVVPRRGYLLDRDEVLSKLERLAPGSTSANAILINPNRVYVLQWFPAEARHVRYYTMHRLTTAQADIVSSEPMATLSAASGWQPLQRGDLIEFKLHSEKEAL